MRTKRLIALYVVIIVHHIIVLGVALACLFNLLFAPWYTGVIGCVTTIMLLTSKSECPVTTLENNIRKSLDMKTIKAFIKHYYYQPIKRIVNKSL